MKINELELGKRCIIALVVTSAIAKETRNKKPYLALKLYDGSDEIAGNYWDWGGKNIPDKNTILDVTAQVTEWQGVKQLNIQAISNNNELHLYDFTPTSNIDIGNVYKEAYNLATKLGDSFLGNLCQGILEDLQGLWLTVPSAKSIHHAYLAGTLIHSVSVAKIAQAMATNVQGANIDLVTAAALLHDVGKLFGYKMNGIVCDLTDEGMLYDHLFIGAEFINSYAQDKTLIKTDEDSDKLEMLRHIILSHHGLQEAGAIVPPASIEAHIVHYADATDAAAEQIRVASTKAGSAKFTDKIWALNNRCHLTTSYVDSVMSQIIELK